MRGVTARSIKSERDQVLPKSKNGIQDALTMKWHIQIGEILVDEVDVILAHPQLASS